MWSAQSEQYFIKQVDPLELPDYWYVVRGGAEKVRAQNGCPWLVEDLYCDIRTGKSILYMSYFNGKYEGFCIMSPIKNQWNGEVELLAWVVYSECSEGSYKFWLKKLFIGLAKQLKARRIVFHSPRPGFKRALEGFGVRVRNIEYEIPVDGQDACYRTGEDRG